MDHMELEGEPQQILFEDAHYMNQNPLEIAEKPIVQSSFCFRNMEDVDQGPNEGMLEEEELARLPRDAFSGPNHVYFQGPSMRPQEIQRSSFFSSRSTSNVNHYQSGRSLLRETHYSHTAEIEEEERKLEEEENQAINLDTLAFDKCEKVFKTVDIRVYGDATETQQNFDNLGVTDDFKSIQAINTLGFQLKKEHKSEVKYEHNSQAMMAMEAEERKETNQILNTQRNTIQPTEIKVPIPQLPTKNTLPQQINGNVLPHAVSSISPQPLVQIHQRIPFYIPQNFPFNTQHSSPQLTRNYSLPFSQHFYNLQPQQQAIFRPAPQSPYQQQGMSLRPNIQKAEQEKEFPNPQQKLSIKSGPLPDQVLTNTGDLVSLEPIVTKQRKRHTPLIKTGLNSASIAKMFANEAPKKKPGKNPHLATKNVGRHFLKVHMKKCIAYALRSPEEVKEEINSYLFESHDPLVSFPKFAFQEQQEEFTKQTVKNFCDWLEALRKSCKDYGKEDFKAAFFIDHRAFLQEIYMLRTEDKEANMRLFGNSTKWNKLLNKEIFRRISLEFIRNLEQGGLISELMSADNISVGTEHIRYAFLTEWLVDDPTRMETAEVFGKRWVQEFFTENSIS